MTVFTSSGPCLENELVLDKDFIRRKIVRITYRFIPTSFVVVRRVYLVVSFQVENGGTVVFKEFLGETGWGRDQDDQVRKRADKAYAHVLKLCDDLGLETRGAAFEG